MIELEPHLIDISESREEESRSEKNKRVLYEAGKNLLPKFLADYPSKLPDAIVLPDTSARPLFYLLRPVLEKVADKRGVPLPKTYFFSRAGAAKASNFAGHQTSTLYYSEENLGKLYEDRKVWSERARQIIEDLRRSGINEPNIIIFDDHISRYAGTSGEISLAFGNELPVYSFTSGWPQELHERYRRKVRIGRLENIQLSNWDYLGIGVTKNDRKAELFVKKASYFNRKIISEFRNEMSGIGRRLAEELAT